MLGLRSPVHPSLSVAAAHTYTPATIRTWNNRRTLLPAVSEQTEVVLGINDRRASHLPEHGQKDRLEYKSDRVRSWRRLHVEREVGTVRQCIDVRRSLSVERAQHVKSESEMCEARVRES